MQEKKGINRTKSTSQEVQQSHDTLEQSGNYQLKNWIVNGMSFLKQ